MLLEVSNFFDCLGFDGVYDARDDGGLSKVSVEKFQGDGSCLYQALEMERSELTAKVKSIIMASQNLASQFSGLFAFYGVTLDEWMKRPERAVLWIEDMEICFVTLLKKRRVSVYRYNGKEFRKLVKHGPEGGDERWIAFINVSTIREPDYHYVKLIKQE